MCLSKCYFMITYLRETPDVVRKIHLTGFAYAVGRRIEFSIAYNIIASFLMWVI